MFWIGIITALLVLNVLVVLHEFGHYITARLLGVSTFEFGVGFPPNIATLWTGKKTLSLKRLPYGCSVNTEKGKIVSVSAQKDPADGKLYAEVIMPDRQPENEIARSNNSQVFIGKVRSVSDDEIVIAPMSWTLNLLPLGGFVRLLADTTKRNVGNMSFRPYWIQITVLLAGVAINVLLPFVLMTVNQWVPTEKFDVVVQGVAPKSPAEDAGLMEDDVVLSVDGRGIDDASELSLAIISRLNGTATWEIMRDGNLVDLEVTSQSNVTNLVVGTDVTLEEAQEYDASLSEGDVLARGFTGIRIAQQELTEQRVVGFWENTFEGLLRGGDLVLYMYNSIAILIFDRTGDVGSMFVGLVGLGQITGNIISAEISVASRISTLLIMASLLSLSLAFFNALPFPPLDGGKVLFVVLMIINRGKAVPARIQNAVNTVGFMALLLLVGYVFLNDITRTFVNG